MGNASTFLRKWRTEGPNQAKPIKHSKGSATPPISLNRAEAAMLRACLAKDAADYLHSAGVTLASSIASIHLKSYTWATIKLYYSAYYCALARVCHGGTAIFHDEGKPFSIEAIAGSSPNAEPGNSHDIAFNLFRSILPGDPLISIPLAESRDPFAWLKRRREEANYRTARLPDPAPRRVFGYIHKHGIRKSANAYIEDHTLMYAFDADHAILAFPIAMFGRCRKVIPRQEPTDGSVRSFLRTACRDGGGAIHPIVRLLTE